MGLFEFAFEDRPTLTFSTALSWAESDFEEDFGNQWGLDANEPPDHIDVDDWRRLQELYHLAQKLAHGASTLIRPRRLSEQRLALPELLAEEARAEQRIASDLLKKVRGRVDDDVYWELEAFFSPSTADDPRIRHVVFDTCLELEAHRIFGTDPGELAYRMLKLVKRMVEQQGELTTAYLSRVAACYVRNMIPEFAVMARAVIDAAIQTRIEDATVAQLAGTATGGFVTLESRIRACDACGMLNSKETAAAGAIRVAGRIAAHETPGLEGDVDVLLDNLVMVLSGLDRTGPIKERG